MSTIADRLDPATRARLFDRLRELSELDALIRERGRQRPPDPPAAPRVLGERNGPGDDRAGAEEQPVTKKEGNP